MSSQDAVQKSIGRVVEEALQELNLDLTQAADQAGEVLASIERETIAEVSRVLEQKDRQAETIRRQILGAAELAARNRSLQIVEQAVNDVFESALKKIGKAASKAEYRRNLKRLLAEAAEAVGGKRIVVLGRKEDLDELNRAAREMEKELKVEIEVGKKTLECSGGLQAQAPDGSIMYDNTFEARLNRLKPLLRKEIATLFTGRAKS